MHLIHRLIKVMNQRFDDVLYWLARYNVFPLTPQAVFFFLIHLLSFSIWKNAKKKKKVITSWIYDIVSLKTSCNFQMCCQVVSARCQRCLHGAIKYIEMFFSFDPANVMLLILKETQLKWQLRNQCPISIMCANKLGGGTTFKKKQNNSLCAERRQIDAAPPVGTNEVPRWQPHGPGSAHRWRHSKGHPHSDSWSSFRRQSNAAARRSLRWRFAPIHHLWLEVWRLSCLSQHANLRSRSKPGSLRAP